MQGRVGLDVAGSLAMLDVTPVVYIVDDDISVREALEGLIQEAGWRPTAFSAHPLISIERGDIGHGPALNITLLFPIPGRNEFDPERRSRMLRLQLGRRFWLFASRSVVIGERSVGPVLNIVVNLPWR